MENFIESKRLQSKRFALKNMSEGMEVGTMQSITKITKILFDPVFFKISLKKSLQIFLNFHQFTLNPNICNSMMILWKAQIR